MRCSGYRENFLVQHRLGGVDFDIYNYALFATVVASTKTNNNGLGRKIRCRSVCVCCFAADKKSF